MGFLNCSTCGGIKLSFVLSDRMTPRSIAVWLLNVEGVSKYSQHMFLPVDTEDFFFLFALSLLCFPFPYFI